MIYSNTVRKDALVRFFAVMFSRHSAAPPQILLLMKQKNVKMSSCECFQWWVENNKGLNISTPSVGFFIDPFSWIQQKWILKLLIRPLIHNSNKMLLLPYFQYAQVINATTVLGCTRVEEASRLLKLWQLLIGIVPINIFCSNALREPFKNLLLSGFCPLRVFGKMIFR